MATQSRDGVLTTWLLMDIENRLTGLPSPKGLGDFGLPQPSADDREEVMRLDARLAIRNLPRIIREELDYDVPALADAARRHRQMLTADQKVVVDHVLDAVENNRPAAVFVHANAGCGKTFTFNTLLESVRANGHIALAVASSGIAATLLQGGTTAHSRFCLPLKPTATSVCNFSAQSDQAELAKRAKLIVWDEGPMAHRLLVETLDRTLRDIMGNNLPFGGKVVVLAGDYRQTLPIVPRGNRAQIVGATHPRSTLWGHFNVFFLRDNMRVLMAGGDAGDSQWYMDWLLRVGDGLEPRPDDAPVDTVPEDYIRIPERLSLSNGTRDGLINAVFPDLAEHQGDSAWMAERAILAPHNDTVNEINNTVLAMMPGDEHAYYSADTIDPASADGDLNVPVEYLNTLEGGGLPSHELRLKKGVPIMLLRSVNSTNEKLCNGTRLIVDEVVNGRLLKAKIAGTGRSVIIPRIPMTPAEGLFPFEWRRRQFPVKVAFAMTINKSQGQTLKRVGIDVLAKPVFTHGQLYVAASRVGDPAGIHVLVPQNRCTRNVVYTDALISERTVARDVIPPRRV